MIYVNIEKLDPPKEWLDKSKALLEELKSLKDDKEARDKLIDKSSSQKQWKKLKQKLKELSYGKCWYSEAREIYSHYHVDHFRPKKKVIDDTTGEKIERDGYWWLTFDWKNYRLAGGVGNTAKSIHFAVRNNCATCPDDDCDDEIFFLLDPTRKNDPKKLVIDEEGKMDALNRNVAHWDHIRAKYTIEKLDLNFPDLKGERKVKWSKVSTLISEIDILEAEYQASPSAKREARLEAKLEEVRKLLAPCEELSATVIACLRASRRDWALALLEENLEVAEICKDYIIPEEKEEDDNE